MMSVYFKHSVLRFWSARLNPGTHATFDPWSIFGIRPSDFVRPFVPLLLAAILLSGCSPRISPLYRDYEVTAEEAASDAIVMERIEEGLQAAGWSIADPVTDNIVATDERSFRTWGLYNVRVSLEVAPIGGDYVRLMIHPCREYAWGRKSKIPYLRKSLARSVLSDLHESFEERGLAFIGTRESRDRAARQGLP